MNWLSLMNVMNVIAAILNLGGALCLAYSFIPETGTLNPKTGEGPVHQIGDYTLVFYKPRKFRCGIWLIVFGFLFSLVSAIISMSLANNLT